jgi:hypothetical protein
MPALRRVPVMLAQGWGGMDALMDSARTGFAMPAQAMPLSPPCVAPAPSGGAGAGKPAFSKELRSSGHLDEAVRRVSSIDRGAPMKKARANRDASIDIKADELTHLLMQQMAAGHFMDDRLLRAKSLNAKAFDGGGWMRELAALGVSGTALATAMTLAVLVVCFADKADLWRPAFKKGMRWLEKHSPAAKGWVEGHVVAAAG